MLLPGTPMLFYVGPNTLVVEQKRRPSTKVIILSMENSPLKVFITNLVNIF